MGPRSEDHGDSIDLALAVGVPDTSMGPRSGGRGEFRFSFKSWRKITFFNGVAIRRWRIVFQDIHLSKILFEEGEDKLFTNFIDSVEYVDRTEPLFTFAFFSYSSGNYQDSMEAYSELLELGGPNSEIYQLRADAHKKNSFHCFCL